MDDRELFSNLEEFPRAEELFRIDAEPEDEAALPEETESNKADGTGRETWDSRKGESGRGCRGVKILLAVLIILLLAAAAFVFYLERFCAGGLQSVVQWL
ncbi:MAG: hypothetical protein HFG99_10150 [Dorea sp.]|jgi:hypothetical protein|nr:hypothetical protein [Dorea sp.]